MKAVRLNEVLRLLLAARARAPWLTEPLRATGPRSGRRPGKQATSPSAWRERGHRRAPFDDVQ